MLDTSFIVNHDEKVPAAVRAMKRLEGRVLLVSAVSWAELGAGPLGVEGIKRARGLEPIAFNTAAAEFLAAYLPPKERSAEATKVAWTADAMIYACAVAGGADAIITDNARDFRAMQEKHGGGAIEILSSADLQPDPTMFDYFESSGAPIGE